MEYSHIIARYGELALKGKNMKYFLEKLRAQIKSVLVDFPKVSFQVRRDHLYIGLNGEDHEPVLKAVKPIFGLQSFSLAIKVDNDVEAIKEAALRVLEQSEGNTFKISAKRPNKDFPIRSQEMNHVIGSHLLKNTDSWKVNVHEPDVNIRIDIRKEATYLTSGRIEGKGGMPVGTAGKSLLLLSGGIDSPVAGYLAMKRGVELEAIHFHSPPFTSERARQKVEDLAEKLAAFGGPIKLHIIPFTKIQQKIHEVYPDRYGMTIMRRMMLRISEAVAAENDILSLITGESLGQVASQTMESMHVINEVTNYPVLRPLVAMDKLEIIDISQEIDTYDISIRPYEDCCTIFVPKSPVIKPKIEKVKAIEAQEDFGDLLKQAVLDKETITIDPSRSAKAEVYKELF